MIFKAAIDANLPVCVDAEDYVYYADTMKAVFSLLEQGIYHAYRER